MSVKYRDASGNTINLSGLTPGGNLEAGAVATREGTYTTTVSISDNSNLQPVITFDSPMPDANYDITIEAVANWPIKSGGLTVVPFHNGDKTANGFRLIIYNTTGADIPAGMAIYWKATKTYTVQHAAETATVVNTIQAAMPSGASSANKLTTASQLSAVENALDTRLDSLEDIIPTGTTISNQLVNASTLATELATKQDTLTFDNAPTAGSDNPVTSDGIKNAFDGIHTALNSKQDALTFDTTPTSGSTNPVTSNGIYLANKGITDLIPSSAATNNKLATNQDILDTRALIGGTGMYIPYVTQFTGRSSTQYTGMVKIHTNQIFNNIMRKFTVDIFDQYSNSTAQYQISSYCYSAGNANRECSACCTGTGARIAHLKVRFGSELINGKRKGCYQIGEPTTDQYFPGIIIRDGIATFNSYNAQQAFSGMSITIESAFDTNDIVSYTIET